MTNLYEEEIYAIRQVFKRDQFGVVLSERGPDDPHVRFTVIGEDDGNWFVSEGGASSSWLSELISVLNEAHRWITRNCAREPSGFGWRFVGWNAESDD